MADIVLNNGSVVEIKINFLTIKTMGEIGLKKLQKKFEKNKNDEDLKMIIASKMVYVILRSSGLMVTEDEALMLVPMDDDTIVNLFKEFEEKMNKFKKKQVNTIQNKMK